jgi:hypothetical protein
MHELYVHILREKDNLSLLHFKQSVLACMNVYTYTYIKIHVYYTPVGVCMNVCTHDHVYIYIYIYIYIYMHMVYVSSRLSCFSVHRPKAEAKAEISRRKT